jgi:hypothetical protein
MNKHRIGALIAAMALTLTFAGTAFASTFEWQGNGYPNATCSADSQTMQWVWTGGTPGTLTINGEDSGDGWVHHGNAWQLQVTLDGTNYPPVNVSLEYTGSAGVLTLSGCNEHLTTTTSESTTTSDETTTTEETTTTTETTTSQETTTSTTTQPTGTLFSFPAFSIECGGFLTVTNFASANVDDALVTGPGDDLVITEDGTYPLVPGDYIGVGRVGGVAATDEVPFTIEACPTTTTSAEETTPGGSVEELTPPSTDTIGAPTSSSTVSTSLLLVLAGALATALVVIPAAARKRR